MEKKAPFFLDKLFRRIPQNSKSNEDNGWGDMTYSTTYNGWGLLPGSTSSAASSNGWGDAGLPEKQYNGWGSDSGSASKHTASKVSENGWGNEPTKDDYNGWDQLVNAPAVANSKGWADELPNDDHNGWDVLESKPTGNIIQQMGNDVGKNLIVDSRQIDGESLATLPVPSAPPLPEEDLPAEVLDYPSVGLTDKEFLATNEGKDSDTSGSSCVVCWEALVEGACVPCGHMAGCMRCLNEIESKQGTCPVCRAKIDKVMRIYVI